MNTDQASYLLVYHITSIFYLKKHLLLSTMNGLTKITCGGMNVWMASETDAAAVSHIVREWWPSHKSNRFPGPQPVSIERKHIHQLFTNDYRVCEKSDGERYLFVCLKYNDLFLTVFINRKQEVILLPFTCENTLFNGTLLDGELVYDRVSQKYNYMVYDCIRAFGDDVSSNALDDRLIRATAALSQLKMNASVGISFRVKQLYPFSQMQYYVNRIVPTLAHAHDGFIFTPNNAPVSSGTDYSMFKWKKRLDNTVDFLVNTDHAPHSAYVMKAGKLLLLRNVCIHIPSEFGACEKRSIIECEYVSDYKWSAVRIRADKTHPNGYLTYTKTLLNIKEDIQLEEFFHGYSG
jgi:mRNA guanylyltransferase